MGRTRRTPVLVSPDLVKDLEPLITWSQLFFRSTYDELLDVRDVLNRELVVYTTPPILGDMKIGEIAIGNGSESSPSADSHALYYKPNESTIVVISTDGSLISIRYIGTTSVASTVSTLTNTNALLSELIEYASLANAHLSIIASAKLELGDTL